MITNNAKEVGDDLVQYAKNAEFCAQRGVLDELFPYIFLASKRLSSRAISLWLKEEKGIKLSFVSIAKALRNADKYWAEIVEAIEPAARLVERAHSVKHEEFLCNRDLFENLKTSPPTLSGNTEQNVHFAHNDYESALAFLENNWFCYDDDVLEECKPFITNKNKELNEV
jgi:hypothetical protein